MSSIIQAQNLVLWAGFVVLNLICTLNSPKKKKPLTPECKLMSINMQNLYWSFEY
jgi:hypothetical protein